MGLGVEAYEDVCNVLDVLCPRLVPKPLWGASIARLVRLRISEAAVLGLEPQQLLKLKQFWWSLKREKCDVCDSPARHIDEDWRYYINGSQGVAVLANLRPLCEKCHLAKHLGFASAIGRDDEAIQHLAQVNRVDAYTVIDLLLEIQIAWAQLSSLESWRIEIAEGVLPEELRKPVEKALNKLINMSSTDTANTTGVDRQRPKAKTLLDYIKKR